MNARLLLLGVLLSGLAFGCECAPAPQPCEAVGRSPAVFLGTVTEAVPQSATGSFRLKVDSVFKGDLGKTVEIFNDLMCGGPELQAGRQYLIYAFMLPGGLAYGCCSRTQPAEFAEEDIAFLKQYAAGPLPMRIFGKTVSWIDAPDKPEAGKLPEPKPLSDADVTLSGNNKVIHAKTGSTGEFSFTDLPPGSYTIEVSLAGYRQRFGPEELELAANACAGADVVLEVDRRVEGHVRSEDGTPLAGVMVAMIAADPSKLEHPPLLLHTTQDDGSYRFEAIPPGDYYLGINIESAPTQGQPYLPMYYPGTPNRDDALRLSFFQGPSVQELNLPAPRRLSVVTVKGRIVTASGKPVPPAARPGVIFGGADGSFLLENGAKVDAEGGFEFPLCEGVRYSVYADDHEPLNSAPTAFTAAKELPEIVLTLDKTSNELEKLLNAIAASPATAPTPPASR